MRTKERRLVKKLIRRMNFWMILALEDKVIGCLDYSTASILVGNKKFSDKEIDYAFDLVSRWFRLHGNIKPRKIVIDKLDRKKILTFYI